MVAKTDDGYFTGFPNFWNILILYLYLFHFPPEDNTLILLLFAALLLTPFKYITHHTEPFHRLTSGCAEPLCRDAVSDRSRDPRGTCLAAVALAPGPAYYFGMSAYLHFAKLNGRG